MDDLVALWGRERFAALYVTHNLAEAVRLGHRVVVLSRRPGRVRESVAIDVPPGRARRPRRELETLRLGLWETIRDEAASADRSCPMPPDVAMPDATTPDIAAPRAAAPAMPRGTADGPSPVPYRGGAFARRALPVWVAPLHLRGPVARLGGGLAYRLISAIVLPAPVRRSPHSAIWWRPACCGAIWGPACSGSCWAGRRA